MSDLYAFLKNMSCYDLAYLLRRAYNEIVRIAKGRKQRGDIFDASEKRLYIYAIDGARLDTRQKG